MYVVPEAASLLLGRLVAVLLRLPPAFFRLAGMHTIHSCAGNGQVRMEWTGEGLTNYCFSDWPQVETSGGWL